MSDYKNVKNMNDAKMGDFRQVNYYSLRKAKEEIAELKKQLVDKQKKCDKKCDGVCSDVDRIVIALTKDLKAERTKSAKLSDKIEFLIDETWELSNKPWRLFHSLAKLVKEYGEPNSQNKEAIDVLNQWAEMVGQGIRLEQVKVEWWKSAKLAEALRGLYAHTKNDMTICGLNTTAEKALAEYEAEK